MTDIFHTPFHAPFYAANFHGRTSFSCTCIVSSITAAAFIAAAVIICSSSRSYADGNTEPPAAEPLILEGAFDGFSPDGKKFATSLWATNKKKISRIYDTTTGKEIAKIESEPQLEYMGMEPQFSPDSKWAITQTKENDQHFFLIYDTTTGKKTAKLKGWYLFGRSNPRFSPDGKQVLIGVLYREKILRIYDTATWKEIAKIEGTYPCFSPDGKWAATSEGSDGTMLRVYNTATWKETAKLKGKGIVEFSPDSKWAATSYGLIYDTATWKETANLKCWINKFTPDGKSAISGDGRVYDTATWKETAKLEKFNMHVDTYIDRFMPDNKSAITASGRVYDMTTWKEIIKIRGYNSNGGHRFTPDCKQMITNSGRIYDTATWQAMEPAVKLKGGDFEFSPDGKWIVGSYEEENTLISTYWIYDAATWKEVAELTAMYPHFLPDGKRAAISAYGKTLITDITQLKCFPKEESIEEYSRKKQAEKKSAEQK